MNNIMKQLSIWEMTNLLGGYCYSSCAEVQYAAGTHQAPPNPSEAEEEAEEKFWDDWCKEFERLCL